MTSGQHISQLSGRAKKEARWDLKYVKRDNQAIIDKCNAPKPPSDYQVLKDMLAANPQFRSKHELNDYVLRTTTKKGRPQSLDEKNNTIQPHF